MSEKIYKAVFLSINSCSCKTAKRLSVLDFIFFLHRRKVQLLNNNYGYFFYKVASFNASEELRAWAVKADLLEDPVVLTRLNQLEVNEAFNESAEGMLLEAVEQVENQDTGKCNILYLVSHKILLKHYN